MKLYATFLSISTAAALALGGTPAAAADNPRVAAEVIALARAQWAAEMSGRPVSEQIGSLSEDYTEFNADHPTLINGRALNARLYEGWAAGPKTVVGDMQNPHVQVYGDTAILSYNYVGLIRSREGDISASNAKSTRVYVRQNGRWMLVHANFNPVRSGN
jgi:ketosteroid isomerase-like protein